MTTERRKYTEEFKREAVRLMESSGKPIAERVCQESDAVGESILGKHPSRRWFWKTG